MTDQEFEKSVELEERMVAQLRERFAITSRRHYVTLGGISFDGVAMPCVVTRLIDGDALRAVELMREDLASNEPIILEGDGLVAHSRGVEVMDGNAILILVESPDVTLAHEMRMAALQAGEGSVFTQEVAFDALKIVSGESSALTDWDAQEAWAREAVPADQKFMACLDDENSYMGATHDEAILACVLATHEDNADDDGFLSYEGVVCIDYSTPLIVSDYVRFDTVVDGLMIQAEDNIADHTSDYPDGDYKFETLSKDHRKMLARRLRREFKGLLRDEGLDRRTDFLFGNRVARRGYVIASAHVSGDPVSIEWLDNITLKECAPEMSEAAHKAMLHALGLGGSVYKPYRNRFICARDANAGCMELERIGCMARVECSNDYGGFWMVTDLGLNALGINIEELKRRLR